MSRYRIEILVTPRPGLLDPEGNAIHHALRSLGYEGVDGVRVGKVMHLDLDAGSQDEARQQAEAMCRKLLANPVTEDYEIQLLGETVAAGISGADGPVTLDPPGDAAGDET